jgi:ubiquinone/menaquinone biosynthesis C-methylase UbiE
LDISENANGLEKLKLDPWTLRIKFILAYATSIPSGHNLFDRVIVTCVLHHIPNLELALTEIRRVAKPGAQINLYVPCDPGSLYRGVRHWTSHFK